MSWKIVFFGFTWIVTHDENQISITSFIPPAYKMRLMENPIFVSASTD